MKNALFILSMCFALTSCSKDKKHAEDNYSDQFETAIAIMKHLSSDEMGGREVGSPERDKALAYLESEVRARDHFQSIEVQPFEFQNSREDPIQKMMGKNLTASIEGKTPGVGPLLIITAHYDHIGTKPNAPTADKIYNGADDNASGSAALFAIAEDFQKNPPEHDILFVWFDAEERGLRGARAFLQDTNKLNGRPSFNINLDMVSRNDKDELYMSGSYHTPALKILLANASQGTGLSLKFGHDRPEEKSNDWTLQSDQGVFHRSGIPFAYFGVEDHPHYHKVSDEFDTIPLDFYRKSIMTLINSAHIIDDNLDDLAKSATQ